MDTSGLGRRRGQADLSGSLPVGGLPVRARRPTPLRRRRSWHRLLLAVPLLLGGCAGGAEGPGADPAPAMPMAQAGDDAQDGSAERTEIRSAPVVRPGAPGTASRTLSHDERRPADPLPHTPADVQFMQNMIHHHLQAVEMSRLVPERTRRADVLLLARRIDRSQDDEIRLMEAWLRTRGETVPLPESAAPTHEDQAAGHHAAHRDTHHDRGDHSRHDGHADHRAEGHESHGDPDTSGMMAGMLTPGQLAELAAARDAHFDRLFLEFMIYHHEGAITMVRELFASRGAARIPRSSSSPIMWVPTSRPRSIGCGAFSAGAAAPPGAARPPAGLHLFHKPRIGFFDERNHPTDSSDLQPEEGSASTLGAPYLPGSRVLRRPCPYPWQGPKRSRTRSSRPTRSPGRARSGLDGCRGGFLEHGPCGQPPGPTGSTTPRPPATAGSRTRTSPSGGIWPSWGTTTASTSTICRIRETPGSGPPWSARAGRATSRSSGDLVFMSAQETRGRLDCGTEGVEEPVSAERFRGVRIFDISNLDSPRAGGGGPDLPRLAHPHAWSPTRTTTPSTSTTPAPADRARRGDGGLRRRAGSRTIPPLRTGAST
jgi:uncharacterized protein (DUF305 family)